jgi:hypothetical protein
MNTIRRKTKTAAHMIAHLADDYAATDWPDTDMAAKAEQLAACAQVLHGFAKEMRDAIAANDARARLGAMGEVPTFVPPQPSSMIPYGVREVR